MPCANATQRGPPRCADEIAVAAEGFQNGPGRTLLAAGHEVRAVKRALGTSSLYFARAASPTEEVEIASLSFTQAGTAGQVELESRRPTGS